MMTALSNPPVFAAGAALLGLCVGSFLNVVVWRLPRIELPEDAPLWKIPYLILNGLSHPRSHCPKCEKQMVKRVAKGGWFFGCSGFPACRGTRRYEEGKKMMEDAWSSMIENEIKAWFDSAAAVSASAAVVVAVATLAF